MTGLAAHDSVDDDEFPDRVSSNGVNPRTGRYAIKAPSIAELCAVATGDPMSKSEVQQAKAAWLQKSQHLGVGYGVDPNSLQQAGWGAVFAANDPHVTEKRARLAQLLGLREKESGPLYKEFFGDNGLRADETGRAFLARFGDAEGPVRVDRVPYYLLLVGSPAEIPFSVQTELHSRHAVGRVDFETLDALEQYANGIVARVIDNVSVAKSAVFFATTNADDQNTERSARELAGPLANSLATKRPGWKVEQQFREQASKQSLVNLLNARTHPSLLMTASHGLALDASDEMQREWQGALVTSEWPGPADTERAMTVDEFFAATDVAPDANLNGMIALFFACFGGGTPRYDEFLPLEDRTLHSLAPSPFVARLPQRLLIAGASAVIAHVERAWSCSFSRPGAGVQIHAFEEAMLKLADGWRVGAAVDALNTKCNEIAGSLASALRDRQFGKMNDDEIAELVLTRTDAANFIILGDPAARLSFDAQ